MKALTLRHPWPWAICVLGKDIENRTWRPKVRELMPGEFFAIHGGKMPTNSDDLDEIKWEATGLAERHRERLSHIPTLGDTIMTGIVAVCKFGGIVEQSPSPWFEGPVGWVLERTVVLPEPIQVRGSQGLWAIPEDLMPEVRRQYREAIDAGAVLASAPGAGGTGR